MNRQENLFNEEAEDQAGSRETKERTRADIAADFATEFLMPCHRGVIDCGDYFIIFGNDGYASDQRSRIEFSEVWGKLREFEPESGISDDGYSWALVLCDYTQKLFDKEKLEKLVWTTWWEVCETHGHKPVESVNPEGVLPEDSRSE